MIVSLVARNTNADIVAKTVVGQGHMGKEQSRIFLDMAEHGEIIAERVPTYPNGMDSPQQADFYLQPDQLIRYFEFCGTQQVPAAVGAIDMIKEHARTPNLQWRVQINH